MAWAVKQVCFTRTSSKRTQKDIAKDGGRRHGRQGV